MSRPWETGGLGRNQFPATQTQIEKLGMTSQAPPAAPAESAPPEPPPPKPSIFWGAFNAAATVVYKLVRRSSGENPKG